MSDLWAGLGSAAGRIIGTLIGLTIGLLLAVFGFWKALFILLCAVVGYLVGQTIDGDEKIEAILRRLLPNR